MEGQARIILGWGGGKSSIQLQDVSSVRQHLDSLNVKTQATWLQPKVIAWVHRWMVGRRNRKGCLAVAQCWSLGLACKNPEVPSVRPSPVAGDGTVVLDNESLESHCQLDQRIIRTLPLYMLPSMASSRFSGGRCCEEPSPDETMESCYQFGLTILTLMDVVQ